jgi:mono/diheme cytochrome c family protein
VTDLNPEIIIRCLLVTILFAAATASQEEVTATPFVASFDRFFHETESDGAAGGRLLLSELSCAACHATEDASLRPKLGPRLDGAGLRLQKKWLQRFLADPQAVKPGTTMPDVLHDLPADKKAHAIAALAAFLSAQREPFRVLNSTGGNPIAHEFWNKGNRDRGRQLYHQVGCVACHEPNEDYDAVAKPSSELEKLLAQLDPDEIRELGLSDAAHPVRSVPHAKLAEKYTRKSLTYFLFQPETVRPGGRMPSLKLKPEEAADIAAYLLRGEADDARPTDPIGDEGLVAEGRKLFSELRCANCHTAKGIKPAKRAMQLAGLNVQAKQSCVAEPKPGAPHFNLNPIQRDSVRRALDSSKSATKAADLVEQLDFHMLQLNCYGCHERTKRGGVGPQRRAYFETAGHVDLGDEGRIPPPLDAVGSKLKVAWLKQVFEGTGDVRPHMLARMPKFAPAAVESLPASFFKADGSDRSTEQDIFPDAAKLIEAGRLLVDVGCVQCHPARGEHLPGVMGVDLAGMANRTQPKWFRDFLLNPAQLKPRTRMPTLFPNRRSGVPAVLDGNVDQQIAAMWAYIKDLDRQPLPEKIVRGKAHNFELVPKERPIVLRTFMKDAGTHAIAVGFPQQVHFAFDAEEVRLVQAWRGRFLDAHGTWFDRFIPPAAPLGTDLIATPAGIPFAKLSTTDEAWPAQGGADAGYNFRGYRLDRSGVPTFLYRLDQYEIEDRIEPAKGKHLRRRIKITDRRPQDEAAALWFRPHVGKHLKLEGELSYSNETGLGVAVSNRVGNAGELRRINGTEEWIIPLEIRSETAIEVNYRW